MVKVYQQAVDINELYLPFKTQVWHHCRSKVISFLSVTLQRTLKVYIDDKNTRRLFPGWIQSGRTYLLTLIMLHVSRFCSSSVIYWFFTSIFLRKPSDWFPSAVNHWYLLWLPPSDLMGMLPGTEVSRCPLIRPTACSPPTVSLPSHRPALQEPPPSLHSHWKQAETGSCHETYELFMMSSWVGLSWVCLLTVIEPPLPLFSVNLLFLSRPSILPEVAPWADLQARRHGAVQGGLTALPRSLHEQQWGESQHRPQQWKPALNVAAQLSPDHTRVETEWRHPRTCWRVRRSGSEGRSLMCYFIFVCMMAA